MLFETDLSGRKHIIPILITIRQAARERREDNGVLMPMAWGWNIDERVG